MCALSVSAFAACNHSWFLDTCDTCGYVCEHPQWVINEWGEQECCICNHLWQYCLECSAPLADGLCSSYPDTHTKGMFVDIEDKDTVFGFMSSVDFSAVLSGVIAVLPTVLLAVVGFIGIRKGLGFLLGRIRSA